MIIDEVSKVKSIMNPTKIFWGLMALIITCNISSPALCLAAVVPYDQLTPQQKGAYAQRVQQVGLSVEQSFSLLETNYQFKVELPAYARCSSCGGTGCAQWQTGTVKKQALCTYCNGGGRIQRKVDSSYAYKNPKVQTLGTVQSSVKYETVNCEYCSGTGRLNVYACSQCAGNGFVAAGRGVYVVGPTSTAAQKAVAGKLYDLLRLVNGKEIRKAQVTKLTEGDVELRHSAGMGKYKRNEFVDEDAAKLFGGPHTAGDEALRRAVIIDLTQISTVNDLGRYIVDQHDSKLLSLLMTMKVPLDYGNSPFLVLMTDKGDTNAIAMFLSRGASIDAQDARGWSALRAAVEQGAVSLVTEYLARDANPNTRDIKSVTPLHVAAAKDSVELVNCLIDHGARIDSTDSQSRTPYDYARLSRVGNRVAKQMEVQISDYTQAKVLVDEDKYDEALVIFNKYKDAGAVKETLLLKGACHTSKMVDLGGGGRMKLMWVPAGSFTMGGLAFEVMWDSDYSPKRPVRLTRGFWIGQTEVTQSQYKEVMGGSNPSHFRGDDLPVEAMNWEDANRFCEELTLRERASLPDGYVFRLPTEAEWEYAARGGDRSRGFSFSGGNDFDAVAWYDGNSGKMTHPVGKKAANELGIFDMSGNAWEWCYDWYQDSYSGLANEDPLGPPTGDARVVRGGCYHDYEKYVSSRSSDFPTAMMMRGGGFRVVLAVPVQSAEVSIRSRISPQDSATINEYAKEGDLAGIIRRIQRGENVNERDGNGAVPLMWAVSGGHQAVVKWLVDNGADMNAKDNDGKMAVQIAADIGANDSITYLLGHGADVNARDNEGLTPLMLAVYKGHVGAVKILTDNGAEVDVRDPDGHTPLFAASTLGYLDIVNILKEKGSDVNTRNPDGITPLMTAVLYKHMNVVKYLVESGADVNAKGNKGETAISVAAKYGLPETSYYLKEHGAEE